jgi:hypothetical protein
MMLSASEARPDAYARDVNGWTVFFLLVAWESSDQAKRDLRGASSPSSQAAPVVGSRSFSRQPPCSFEAQPARRACRLTGTGTTARAAVHGGGCGAGSRGVSVGLAVTGHLYHAL